MGGVQGLKGTAGNEAGQESLICLKCRMLRVHIRDYSTFH